MFFLLSEALLPAGAAIVTTALHDLGPNWVSQRMGAPKYPVVDHHFPQKMISVT
jgi:hypothetical protein